MNTANPGQPESSSVVIKQTDTNSSGGIASYILNLAAAALAPVGLLATSIKF